MMSNHTNETLIELAYELEEYWLGTPHADLIRQDLDAKDFESLQVHVARAHAAQFDQEFAPRQENVQQEA